MSTEVAKKPTSLKGILSTAAMQQQFAAALPRHLSPERFTRVAITALTRTPKLTECTQESFFKCLLDLSAMGLEPDGRRAHLIPYGKECTLVVDYKGLVELVRRSGDVAKIHADIVCENDMFQHSMGEITEHTYDLRKERGEPYAAYAQVTLKDGSVQAEIMSKADVESIRAKSKAGRAGPWVDHWNEMAKKTAFRRLTKWLTLSPEVQDRIAKADDYEFAMRDVTPETAKIPTENPFVKKSAPEPEPENQQEEPEPLTLDGGDNLTRGYFESYKVQESKPGANKPWKLWRMKFIMDGAEREAVTFSETIGTEIEYMEPDDTFLIEIEDSPKGDTIKSIRREEVPA